MSFESEQGHPVWYPIAFALLMLLALAGCGESVSERSANEKRDGDIRRMERTQDTIDADSIEARLGRLEADVELLKMRGR